jgi:hypothetical protein
MPGGVEGVLPVVVGGGGGRATRHVQRGAGEAGGVVTRQRARPTTSQRDQTIFCYENT